jgi:uncharacterized protein (TIGR03437 family)
MNSIPRFIISLSFVGLSLLLRSGAAAQGAPRLEPFLAGLSSPVLVTHAGDDRLFIVEQTGAIKVLRPGATAPTEFINLSTKIVAGGERGLLGLAFHPLFGANRRFFVNYTRAGDGATVISEFQASAANPDRADPTEKIILTISQPYANHNGGMIGFGPDGYLYIGMGDGGSANDPGNRAQDVNELLGKMLRIDIDRAGAQLPYSSPEGNPFAGPAPGRDEIFALGLRNPWRWSFDRATGRLFAGDVGQGQIEEVSIITLGGNYGWRVYEGQRCTGLGPGFCLQMGFIPPILQYDHSMNGRCSITGGYVYRGSRGALPFGAYIYGDYCSGEIFIYDHVQSTRLLDTEMNISSFGEDRSGELYVVDIGGSVLKFVNPAVRPAATVSAASLAAGPMAPDSIAAVFGTDLATTTQTAGVPAPGLGGTRLVVRDVEGVEREASIFYVSPTQVNYLIPGETAGGPAILTVTSASGAISISPLQISAVAPALFAANADGRGVAAAYLIRRSVGGFDTFEPVAVYDPARGAFTARPIAFGSPGEELYLVLFGTGIRSLSSLAGVSALIGGSAAEVIYAGRQFEFAGLDQINLRLRPELAGRGEVEIALTIDGRPVNMVTINLK